MWALGTRVPDSSSCSVGTYIHSSFWKQRETIIKFLIAGTFPVILSCLLQLVFKIHGPFETLNGLIVWFQKPITGGRGVSGLFSNQNYTGVWLTTLLPFTLLQLSNAKNRYFGK